MFDQHQNNTWKSAFPVRNLVAWSAAPLLLFPTHYTGEDGYISDTEQSDTIKVLGTVYFHKYSIQYRKEPILDVSHGFSCMSWLSFAIDLTTHILIDL